MGQETLAVHYELYALRQGRWLMDGCFADADDAQAAATRLRHAADVRGVRLVRELTLPHGHEPVVTVLYDSTQPEQTLAWKTAPTAAVSAQRGPARPNMVEEADTMGGGHGWIVHLIGATALATAAAIATLTLL